jgi:hypothetical protein
MPKLARPAAGRRKTGKLHPLNMRTTAEIRTRLVKAAADSGRSLAQEVEHRLERSFQNKETLEGALNDVLGGPATAAALRHLAGIALEIERGSGDRHWLMYDDVFDRVITAWKHRLDEMAKPSARVQEDIDGEAVALEAKLQMIAVDPGPVLDFVRFNLNRYSSPARERLAELITAAETRLQETKK